jgi:hypothetical protein
VNEYEFDCNGGQCEFCKKHAVIFIADGELCVFMRDDDDGLRGTDTFTAQEIANCLDEHERTIRVEGVGEMEIADEDAAGIATWLQSVGIHLPEPTIEE